MSETQIKTATLLRAGLLHGNANLYRVDPPMSYDEPWDPDDKTPAKTTEFVIVSAVDVMFSGPETYIFPANQDGEVIDWGELNGSYRGGLDHAKALHGAGYEVAS